MSPSLLGRSVMIVEPDTFLYGYISTALTKHGADVRGPFRDAEHCSDYLDGAAVHAAVLSLDDPAADPWPIAALLERRAIPTMFICAETAEIAPEFQNVPHLRKPLASFQVVETVLALMSIKEEEEQSCRSLA